jgi:ubiquinone/menaquinone biosynthesis C-methylase UbiE
MVATMISNRSTELLKSQFGMIDATELTAVFDRLNIDAYKVDSNTVIIPSRKISRKELQDELSKIKTASHRKFHCVEENGQLIISWQAKFKSIFSHWLDVEEPKEYTGVTPNSQILPAIPIGSTVLDIGAGDGTNALRMRNQFSCNVYALEPSFEGTDDFDNCQLALGQAKAAKLTLQEAVAQFPDFYLQKFDVVTIFKFNVPYNQLESFFAALTRVIKPGGTLYISCVERERLQRSQKLSAMYIMDHLKNHFNFVSFIERSTDGEITCREPKCLTPANESILRIAKR